MPQLVTCLQIFSAGLFVILDFYNVGVISQADIFTTPEIKLKKWISDTDRDYLDLTDVDQFVGWDENVDTPEIQISGLRSHEFSFSQHVASVLIECKAAYPVQWMFHNAKFVTEDLHGILMKTFRRAGSVVDKGSNLFMATLEISSQSNKATGKYSCCSTFQNAHLCNDIFIFWEGSSASYLVLGGRLLKLEMKSDNAVYDGSITVPCYVSQPSTPAIQLHKEIDGEYKSLPKSLVSSQFDPQIGFVLSYKNNSDVLGRYRCSVIAENEDDEGDSMEVLIIRRNTLGNTRPDPSCENESCLRRKLLPGTSFKFDEKTEEILCCGRAGEKPTRMHSIFCSNPSVCRMYESSMFSLSGSMSVLRRSSRNGSCIAEKIYPRDFGLVRCIGSGIDVFTYVYTEFWTPSQESINAVFDWTQLNPQNMVHVMFHTSPPYYDGQHVVATCQTLHSYFSDGIKWGIKYVNGSKSYFDSLMSTNTDPRLHGIRSTYLRLHSNLSEIICFAPVWNSTEWVDKSLVVAVKPSKPPVIVGNHVEKLTFSLNDTEKVLECISSGEPTARLKWTKNEEEVPTNMVLWNQTGSSGLVFKTVSFENQGIYKCISMNEVGQAVKTFRIFIEVSGTTDNGWSTAFAIVIPIIVILFMVVLAFLLWKMRLQKNVVTHLTRVVFRENGGS